MINTWPGWQNVGLIGEGSYGKVYRIQREEFGQTYEAALKVITIPQSEGDVQAVYSEGLTEESVTEYFRSFVEDIVAEFALMSQLKGNSNIVSYEDHMVISHEDGIGWDILIRMELLTPLMVYSREHPLTEEDVIRMGEGLSQALALCRKKGIIHRDIKPENIFVSADGNFKLGDFGVARVAEKTVSAMSRKGTYGYMAPEVYKGEEYGYAADIYSLGLVLYRYLNDNRAPFMPPYPKPIQYSDREKALNMRMAGQPLPTPAHGSGALKAVVLRACAYKPEERFADAEEMRMALNRLGEGSAAKTPQGVRPAQETRLSETAEEQAGAAYRGEAFSETAASGAGDEDDFDRTVSAFSGHGPVKQKPVKKPEPVPEEPEPVMESEPVPADDEDDFDRTVSAFSGHGPVKQKPVAKPEPEPEPEEAEYAAEADAAPVGDEDDFDRTVSAFSGRKQGGGTGGNQKADMAAGQTDIETGKFENGAGPSRGIGAVKPISGPLKAVMILVIILDVAVGLMYMAIGFYPYIVTVAAFWAVVLTARKNGLYAGTGGKKSKGMGIVRIVCLVAMRLLGLIVGPASLVMSLISWVIAFLVLKGGQRPA